MNLLKGLRSVNNPRPSSIESSFLKHANGKTAQQSAERFISDYIMRNAINIEMALDRVRVVWAAIHQQFVARVEALFQCRYPLGSIGVYLTIDSRCTYDIHRNLFYVSMQAKYPAVHIMHELFHFYTYHSLVVHGRNDVLRMIRYNDFKESLTEIINISFRDLIEEGADKGYPQHSGDRALIRKLWMQYGDFYRMLDDIRIKMAFAA